MRLLGVDFGGKRIGIAVAEFPAGLPSSRPALSATGTLAKDAAALCDFARREEATRVVLGLPLDSEGETRMSAVCRKLGSALEALGMEVAYQDESLTSREAERAMLAAGLKGAQVKRRVDGEAACRILERYLEKADG
ncbi:MAG: Holliday junction resolvase RuvX [Fimbriimonadaceae bacterium]